VLFIAHLLFDITHLNHQHITINKVTKYKLKKVSLKIAYSKFKF